MYKVIFEEWHGGKYGKPSVYEAIVIPSKFKNGKMKKTDFEVVEITETLQRGYSYGNAATSQRIIKVIGEV